MQLHISDAAVDCFIKEWGFSKGESIRIFVRYVSGGQEPYALGITRDDPIHPALSANAGGIGFFMEHNDVWFLEGKDLAIDASGEDIILKTG
ncbi:HesB/YadR/YfhF family protein [Paenibacillus protaetiae]|uniref:Fe-S cluster assembly protein HesB n=1 Tax=Paenibacillus protaetiae TaxID=2509456 RepID=A0A4P6EVM4_9BACL|nr:Fe-S cluster assembly protein HesB [Paenibacillus protaetiae]QAY67054.1 Fe-S cluster assembly protein HesB [Paenibacillus protaetiae]